MSNAPFTDPQFGIANWQNYINNWREEDAEYLQARTIARFQDAAARNSGLASPSPGQVVYNQAQDYLELRSKNNVWLSYRGLPQNIAVPSDDGTSVVLAHVGAAGKGISLGAAQVDIPGKLVVFNGVTTTDNTGLAIKVGSRTAKLITDATNLISDTPITAPSVVLTGTGTVLSAPSKTVAVGTLTADSATIPNITLSGTLTGGVINGTSGTIGGTAHTAGGNVTAGGRFDVTGGYTSQFGHFYGDSASAVMRWRNTSGGALGAAYVQAQQTNVILNSPSAIQFYGQPQFMGAQQIRWYDNANAHRGYLGPVFYGGSDPASYGAQDGSIWFT